MHVRRCNAGRNYLNITDISSRFPVGTRGRRMALYCFTTAEFTFDGANQRIYVRRLHQITVYSVLNGTAVSNAGYPVKQNGDTVGVTFSHGTYDSEAIAILSNVEIGYQHVELATSHFGKCFEYASRNRTSKPAGGGSPRHRWVRLPLASAIASHGLPASAVWLNRSEGT